MNGDIPQHRVECMKRHAFLTIICLFAVLQYPRITHAFTLVRDGLPMSFIVIDSSAEAVERFAAAELVSHVSRMTGADIPIREMEYGDIPSSGRVVLLGAGPWLDLERFGDAAEEMDMLGDQGFVIRAFEDTEPRVLIVGGASPRGTIHAVYELLRIIGVRWYAPDVTSLPSLKTIALGDIALGDLPCFDFRGADMAFPGESALWKSRLRLNAGNGYMERELGCDPVYSPLETKLIDLVPTDLFEDTPDLFPLIDGSRTPESGNRCLSNPETAFAAADSIIALLERFPETTTVTVAFGDSIGLCECDGCRSIRERGGAESELAVTWADLVSETVTAVYPGIVVEIALSGIFERPSPRGVPGESVVIRLIPEGADQRLFYEDSIDMRTMRFVDHLRGWRGVNARIVIDHPCGNMVEPAVPFPDFRQIIGNVGMYHYEFVEGCFFRSAATPGLRVADAELRTWLLSELMWDRYRDGETLVREWIKGIYGNASGAMWDYWRHIRKIAELPNIRITDRTSPADYLSEDWLLQAERMLDRAYALSMTDSTARAYVVRERFSLRYARLLDMISPPVSDRDRKRIRALLDSWLADAAEIGCERVSDSLTCAEFAAIVIEMVK